MERCIDNLIYEAVKSAYTSYIDYTNNPPEKLDKFFKQLIILNIIKNLFEYIKNTKFKYFYFNPLTFKKFNFSEKLQQFIISFVYKLNNMIPIYISFINDTVDINVLYAQYLTSIEKFESYKKFKGFLKRNNINLKNWSPDIFIQ